MDKSAVNYCTEPNMRFFKSVTRRRRRKPLGAMAWYVGYDYFDSRTEVIDGVYYVYPVALNQSSVFICCPHCHSFHAHGNPIGGNYAGPRPNVCGVGYYIRPLREDEPAYNKTRWYRERDR